MSDIDVNDQPAALLAYDGMGGAHVLCELGVPKDAHVEPDAVVADS